MNIIKSFCTAALAGSMLVGVSAFAAPQAKTYQVTGPVLEVTDSSITVQKGEEKWQVVRGKDTKITGDLKVGAKVTIYYQMVASEVEAKAEGKGDAKAGEKKKKK